MSIDQLFFQLLQVAIGNRKSLDRMPSTEEWVALFDMAKKQALTAIAFTGVTRLNVASDFGASLGIPEVTYLKWLGLTAKVAQRNKELNAECAKVCAELAHDGLQCCVLKGQSNLVNYPEDLRECRTAGDIDLWCDVPDGIEVAHEVGGEIEKREYRGMEGVIEYCKQYERCQGREIPWHRVLYYHCELTSPSGIGIEPHYRPSYLNSPLRNWRLQRWFRENEQFGVCDFAVGGDKTKTIKTPEEAASACASENSSDGSTSSPQRLGSSATQSSAAIDNGDYTSSGKKQEKQPSGSFPIPTVSFNAVYQLLHIYKHLFEEGIGLRQLLDYYFVLRALHIEQGELADRTQSMAQWAEGMGVAVKSNEEIMYTLSRFGMRKFASATMWVLKEVFAMPDVYLLCPPNEKEGKFLLNEIMQAGNFGKYDTRISHSTSQMGHAWEKLKHNMRLIHHYPEEVICEPFFRLYHYFWRRFELWRW